MSMILERSQEPLGEIVNEVRQAQAFWQIEGLFKRLAERQLTERN